MCECGRKRVGGICIYVCVEIVEVFGVLVSVYVCRCVGLCVCLCVEGRWVCMCVGLSV